MDIQLLLRLVGLCQYYLNGVPACGADGWVATFDYNKITVYCVIKPKHICYVPARAGYFGVKLGLIWVNVSRENTLSLRKR